MLKQLDIQLKKTINFYVTMYVCVKESTCNAGDTGDRSLILGSGGSLRRKWQPTPVFLPEKSHGQRSLVGYSLWSHKELDMTEQLQNNNKIISFSKSEKHLDLVLPIEAVASQV